VAKNPTTEEEWSLQTSTIAGTSVYSYTAKTQYRKFETNIFPEKELSGFSPNFQIHVFESHLYIPTIGLPILLQENMWSWENINRSETHECGNWDCGRTIPFLGIQYINGIAVYLITRTDFWIVFYEITLLWSAK
jgi:hypothetical protein